MKKAKPIFIHEIKLGILKKAEGNKFERAGEDYSPTPPMNRNLDASINDREPLFFYLDKLLDSRV